MISNLLFPISILPNTPHNSPPSQHSVFCSTCNPRSIHASFTHHSRIIHASFTQHSRNTMQHLYITQHAPYQLQHQIQYQTSYKVCYKVLMLHYRPRCPCWRLSVLPCCLRMSQASPSSSSSSLSTVTLLAVQRCVAIERSTQLSTLYWVSHYQILSRRTETDIFNEWIFGRTGRHNCP